MRSASLSFVVLLLGCSNDGFTGQDGGSTDGPVGTIEGGGVDAPADNFVPPPIRRVFVANQNTTSAKPVVAWDTCDKLSMDRAPDVELVGGMTTSTALVIAKDRLYAWDDSSHVLTGFDNAGALTSSSLVTIGLGASAFLGTGTANVFSLVYSKANDVLFTTNPFVMSNAVQMFTKASTMANGTKAAAQFGATNESFFAVAHDSTADRLFLGDLPQTVIKYIDTASTRTGAQSLTMDFAPSPPMLAHAMAIDATRLYVASDASGAARVYVYNLSGVHPGSAPDVTLTSANGLPAMGICMAMAVANDTLSVACGGKVVSFAGAKSVSASSQGTPLTNDAINTARVAISAKTGLLYTTGLYKGNAGLQVWKSPASGPSLQAEMRTGIGSQPLDIALYEP